MEGESDGEAMKFLAPPNRIASGFRLSWLAATPQASACLTKFGGVLPNQAQANVRDLDRQPLSPNTESLIHFTFALLYICALSFHVQRAKIVKDHYQIEYHPIAPCRSRFTLAIDRARNFEYSHHCHQQPWRTS